GVKLWVHSSSRPKAPAASAATATTPRPRRPERTSPRATSAPRIAYTPACTSLSAPVKPVCGIWSDGREDKKRISAAHAPGGNHDAARRRAAAATSHLPLAERLGAEPLEQGVGVGGVRCHR